MKKLFSISLLFLCASHLVAQDQHRIDSLTKLYATLTEDDTVKVRVINSLAWDISYTNLDSGLVLVRGSLAMAKELNFKAGEAEAQNVIGTIYADLGRYPEAVNAHLQAIRIRDSINCDPGKLGESYHNLSLVYESMDSVSTALHYQKLAYTYYHKSTKDSSGIAPIANYLARHYVDKDSFDLAREYFIEGKRYGEIYRLKHWIAVNTAGLAFCYAVDRNFSQADSLIDEAFMIGKSENSEYDMMSLWLYISKVREIEGNVPSAIAALDSALEISTRLKVRDSRMNHLNMLAKLYEVSGNQKLALRFYQEYQSLKDSILSSKNQQNIKNLETVYEKEKTEKALAIAREQDSQQKIYVAGGIVCSVGFIVFAVLLFGRIRLGKKAAVVLEKQKAIIESKNKDITDSINYARRIQEAVSPVESQLRNIFEKSFVFNRPRSIVSGDFWWIAETDDRYFVAVGDCSGHGVPGAFMSVVAASFLNGIVIENKVYAPEEILFELNNKVRAALQHEGTGESVPLVSDTIEIAVCSFNKSKTQMEFASAGMQVIVVSHSQVVEYRGHEKRAGSVDGNANPYSRNSAALKNGDKLFLFSDGLMSLPGSDQRHVYDLLSTVETQDEIADYIKNHCGSMEQPDDILVIGLQL